VGLGLNSEHALELISEIVREASCPVIAVLSAKDLSYVHEAANAVSSPTSLTALRRICRARSISPCSASASTRACRGVWSAGPDRAGEEDSDGTPCD